MTDMNKRLDEAMDLLAGPNVLYTLIIVVSEREDGSGLHTDGAHGSNVEIIAQTLHHLPAQVSQAAANLVGLAIGNPVVPEGTVVQNDANYTPGVKN